VAVDKQATMHVYEVDGEEELAPDVKLVLTSHWNSTRLVVVEVGGRTYTVGVMDLHDALRSVAT
jgi:hypothetical protein